MSGFVAELGWRHLNLGSDARGWTRFGSINRLGPLESGVNRWSRKIAGAAVNATNLTNPAVTLEAEGQSPESRMR
jgi:hypothetical protein